MRSPLSGIRIVEFGQYIAAPAATMVLADLGADVVKIESPSGDSTRSLGSFGEGMFHGCNRGKRSIVLNLRDADDLAMASRLIDGADVVVQNLRPGALDGLGLGADASVGRNPLLIYVSISGFGSKGHAATRAGLDIAAQAETGMMSVTGEFEADPLRIGFAVVDSMTANAAAQAVLAALFSRDRTGRGEVIELSLFEVGIQAQASEWARYWLTGSVPTRRGNGQANAAPAADLVETRDGHIVLSAYTGHHWKALCELIERPELAYDAELGTLEGRVLHRKRLLGILRESLSSRTSEECVNWLGQRGIVAGAVRSYDQVGNSFEAQDLEVFPRFSQPPTAGPERYSRLPYRFSSGSAPVSSSPAPRLGEHTDMIRAEIVNGDWDCVGGLASSAGDT